MAAISSVGIGSGLDVKSIVSQLVALEKKPLVALQKADTLNDTRISTYGKLKSLVSTFADAAAKLTRDAGWNNLSVASSNSSAVNAAVSGFASAGNYSVSVSKLAQAQTTTTGAVPKGTLLGAGTVTLTVNGGSPTVINIGDGTGDTSLAGIASKINGANAGVTASVITDASGDRLMLRSTATGADKAFTVSAQSTSPSTGLDGLVFSTTQPAQNTEAKINGVDVVSSNRTFADTIPGLTFTASAVTTTAAEIAVTADTATTKKNVQAFVDAYNAVNDLLASSTKYDATSKVAGELQGDATTVGLQNLLRTTMGRIAKNDGPFSQLSDIGISIQRGGNLAVDATKLDKALSTTEGADNVKKLFATAGSGDNMGVAARFKALTTDMLSLTGTFANKTAALAKVHKLNADEQDKVNTRAGQVETRLNTQYSALDSKMATLNALNTYVSQQVTAWNKSTK